MNGRGPEAGKSLAESEITKATTVVASGPPNLWRILIAVLATASLSLGTEAYAADIAFVMQNITLGNLILLCIAATWTQATSVKYIAAVAAIKSSASSPSLADPTAANITPISATLNSNITSPSISSRDRLESLREVNTLVVWQLEASPISFIYQSDRIHLESLGEK